jgi:hypothetical protein
LLKIQKKRFFCFLHAPPQLKLFLRNLVKNEHLYPIGKFEFSIPKHFLGNQFGISKVEPKSSNLGFAASPHVLRWITSLNIPGDGTCTH